MKQNEESKVQNNSDMKQKEDSKVQNNYGMKQNEESKVKQDSGMKQKEDSKVQKDSDMKQKEKMPGMNEKAREQINERKGRNDQTCERTSKECGQDKRRGVIYNTGLSPASDDPYDPYDDQRSEIEKIMQMHAEALKNEQALKQTEEQKLNHDSGMKQKEESKGSNDKGKEQIEDAHENMSEVDTTGPVQPSGLFSIICKFCDPRKQITASTAQELEYRMFDHMDQHEDKHDGNDDKMKEGFYYTCTSCIGMDFDDETGLKNHIDEQHRTSVSDDNLILNAVSNNVETTKKSNLETEQENDEDVSDTDTESWISDTEVVEPCVLTLSFDPSHEEIEIEM